MSPGGRRFYKMSGSGNDFVFFDARSEPAGTLTSASEIQRICARGTGVGADGIVVLRPSPTASVGIDYYNSDGSLASLCGNATLCATGLSILLGIAPPGAAGLTVETGAGVLAARVTEGLPEIDLEPVTVVKGRFDAPLGPGEQAIGFAVAGVPHLVVLSDDVDGIDVPARGPVLRHHRSLVDGANVNWVSRRPDGQWAMRTFERGVEGETLACGIGAVAVAVLLATWGRGGLETPLVTRSGRVLVVRLGRGQAEAGSRKPEASRHSPGPDTPVWRPTLRGEGRLVFEGKLPEA